MSNPQQLAEDILKNALQPTPEPEKETESETPVETLEAEEQAPLDESQSLETPEPDESQEEVDTLNDLASELEIDIADMYALNLKMPDGNAITLGQLKDFYEGNSDIESQREDVKNREAELQAESDKLREIPKVSNELVQAQARVLAIQNQWDNTNWEALKAQGTGIYADTQAEFRNQFEVAKANLVTAEQTVETHRVESRRLAQERLFEALPELKDDAHREKVGAEVVKFAQRYNFTSQDVANIDDPRLMQLLIESSRKGIAHETAKAKKVDTTPKVLRPNATRQTNATRKASLKRLTERARATGRTEDKAAAVAALLKR